MRNSTCPVCKNGLENIICCPRCMTPMHRDCGTLMGGKCATLYCEESSGQTDRKALPPGQPSRFTTLLERLLVIAPTPPEPGAESEYNTIIGQLIEMAPGMERKEALQRLGEAFPFLKPRQQAVPDGKALTVYQETLQRTMSYRVEPPGFWERFKGIFDADLARANDPGREIAKHLERFPLNDDGTLVIAQIQGYDPLTQARVLDELIRQRPLDGIEKLDAIRAQLFENVAKDLFAVGRYDDAITVAHESADLTLYRKVTYAAGKHYLDNGMMGNKAWDAFFKGKHYEEALEAAFQPPGLLFVHYQEIYHAHVEASDLPKPIAEALFAQYFHRRIQNLQHGIEVKIFAQLAHKSLPKAYAYLESKNDLAGILDLAQEFDDKAKIQEINSRLGEFHERQGRLEDATGTTGPQEPKRYLLSGAKDPQLPP